MRETRRHAGSAAGRTRRNGRRPTLRLIRGRAAGSPEPARRAAATASRRALVTRARSRAAAGYYERPRVRERLVDCPWEELFSD